MALRVGDPVKYLGKQWHVTEVYLDKQSYLLVDKAIVAAIEPERCMYVEVTAEKLAQDSLPSANTRAAQIKQVIEDAAVKQSQYTVDEGVTMADWVQTVKVDWQMRQAASSPLAFGVTVNLTEKDKLRPGAPGWEEQCDTSVAKPRCDGWHLMYELPEVDGGTLFEYDREREVQPCADLEECWVYADFCIDEEIGEPLAIKKDTCAIYLHDGDGWARVRSDYPPVSQWV